MKGCGYWGSPESAVDRLWDLADQQVAAGERCGSCGYLRPCTCSKTDDKEGGTQ